MRSHLTPFTFFCGGPHQQLANQAQMPQVSSFPNQQTNNTETTPVTPKLCTSAAAILAWNATKTRFSGWIVFFPKPSFFSDGELLNFKGEVSLPNKISQILFLPKNQVECSTHSSSWKLFPMSFITDIHIRPFQPSAQTPKTASTALRSVASPKSS